MKIVYDGPGALGARQTRYEFDNGYGASLIVGGMAAYGGRELAVLHNGNLCYATPLTDDVIGYLGADEVQPLLDQIEALPVNTSCTHDHDWSAANNE